jgi:hypothetical protein
MVMIFLLQPTTHRQLAADAGSEDAGDPTAADE